MVVLGFLLVLGPWTLRNAVLFGQFVPVSANSGYVLMVNNNDANAHGGWMPLKDVPSRLTTRPGSPMLDFPKGSSAEKARTGSSATGRLRPT